MTANREMLRRIDLFMELDEKQLDEVMATAKEVHCQKGDYIIHENDYDDCIYIIQTGSVKITKIDAKSNKAHIIATLGKGEMLGEMSLVDRSPRSASAIATGPASLLSFSIKELQEHKKELYYLLMKGVAKSLSTRLKTSNVAVVESLRKQLKNAKKQILLEFIILVILSFLLINTGMTIYYIYHTSDFCSLIYPQSQPGTARTR